MSAFWELSASDLFGSDIDYSSVRKLYGNLDSLKSIEKETVKSLFKKLIRFMEATLPGESLSDEVKDAYLSLLNEIASEIQRLKEAPCENDATASLACDYVIRSINNQLDLIRTNTPNANALEWFEDDRNLLKPLIIAHTKKSERNKTQ